MFENSIRTGITVLSLAMLLKAISLAISSIPKVPFVLATAKNFSSETPFFMYFFFFALKKLTY